MGSVDPNYRCPHCGVVGMGGYALDGINYPVCTEGAANCLDKALNLGYFTRAQVKQALVQILFSRRSVAIANPTLFEVTSGHLVAQIASYL